MVVVMGEDSDEVIYFQLRHGLHDELAVMAEEEEASTGTSSFSRILNLFDIFGRLQWFDDVLIFDTVTTEVDASQNVREFEENHGQRFNLAFVKSVVLQSEFTVDNFKENR